MVVDVWSEAPSVFQPGSTVTARMPDGATRPVIIETARPFGERLLLRFVGVGSRTEAEALRGAD